MKKKTAGIVQNAKANPITSFLGILALAASIAPIWAPANISGKIQQTAATAAGLGLIFAPDAGKKQQ